MFAYVESVLVIVLEVLCCRIFYGAFARKRKKRKAWTECVLLILLIMEFFCSALLFEKIVLIKVMMVVMGAAIVMHWIIDMSFIKSLITAFLYEGLVFVVDYLTFLLCITVFKDVAEIDNMYYVQGGLLVLLDKIILFFTVLIIRKTVSSYDIEIIKDTDWLKFIVFPIYTVCMIVGMIFVLDNPSSFQKNNIILFLTAFGLVGMNVMVFYLINDFMKKEKMLHEERMFRFQMKNQTQMYYSISENLERQRKKTHEYKNQMVCIKSLLRSDKIKEVNEYINQIGDALGTQSDNFSTNHVIVDAILNTKYREMTEKNIVFVLRINDLSKMTISDEDVVVILSNLLNNAIEACEKCQERKRIKLKFIMERNTAIISVRNTYENVLVKDHGMLLTTKNERADHGIGIRNIVTIIEKYGGSYVIKPEDGEFYFSMMIPQETEEG